LRYVKGKLLSLVIKLDIAIDVRLYALICNKRTTGVLTCNKRNRCWSLQFQI